MDQTATPLLVRFGDRFPRWMLREDSNALNLQDLTGTTLEAVLLTKEQAESIRALTGSTRGVELEVRVEDEAVHLMLVGKRTDTNTWTGFASDHSDTSAVAEALERGLTFSEQVVSEVHSLVVIIDQNGKLLRLNKLCEEVTGLREVDLIGKNAHDLFMPQAEHADARKNIAKFFETGESWEVERPINTQHGVLDILWRNKFVQGGPGEGKFLVCSGRDITAEKAAKAALVTQATTDTLTGLPNRHAIQELLTARLSDASTSPFAVLFLDLDNFKQVNDHYGHAKGDLLIKAVAVLIGGCMRDGDVLARLGGDEMLLVLNEANAQSALAVAGRIHERMRSPITLDRVELHTNCSIGIALAPEHGSTLNELIRNADTAMYCAKDAGKGSAKLFVPEMNAKAREYIWLDANLRKALETDQLQLHYQPKVDLRTGKVQSVEALLRWNHPERGNVPPDAFIPYAEESGIIHGLGAWVIREAAKQATAWKEAGLDLRVAVNISARQLANDEVVKHFARALREAGQIHSLLDIELTESCLAHDETLALDLINQLKSYGAEVHLDDFGTGYSSLSQLVRMPVDVLKMDKSFIQNLCNDVRSRALVRSVVAVSQELNCKLVAEGVETEDQATLLRELGVAQAQGYLYAKPMAAPQLTEWMQSQAKKPRLQLVA